MTNKAAILAVLTDGNEWKLWDLRDNVIRLTGRMCSETGLSAEVRDLRKVGYDIPGHFLKDPLTGKKTKTFVYQMGKRVPTVEECERLLMA